MMPDELCNLSCPCGIHYICDMTLTCNGALHCICTDTSHFMGVSAWLKLTPHWVIDKWARYHWTKFNRVARSHDM